VITRRAFVSSLGVAGAGAGLEARQPETRRRTAEPSARIVAGDAHAVAETAYGKVRGYIEAGIYTFKGVPYAASPTGAGRFTPPRLLPTIVMGGAARRACHA
jgi:para-nitrobenzyl esterase